MYTKQLPLPDQLAVSIAAPLPPVTSPGLRLWGWAESRPDSAVLAIITAYLDEDSLESPPLLPLEQARDVFRMAPALLEIKLRDLEDWFEIDPASELITFYQDHDGTPLKAPSTVPVTWYITHRVENIWQQELHQRLGRPLEDEDKGGRARQRTLELIGGEIAGQRVALNVTGNVAIKGGVIFKDQSKSVTNFRANKNWELQIDQTQRFDIEGT
ncbi:MAG: hypothetical protein V3W14_02210, partial [Candidatus Neomarinimicrobiota bacterium]